MVIDKVYKKKDFIRLDFAGQTERRQDPNRSINRELVIIRKKKTQRDRSKHTVSARTQS